MERLILNTLNFKMGAPLCLHFLRRMVCFVLAPASAPPLPRPFQCARPEKNTTPGFSLHFSAAYLHRFGVLRAHLVPTRPQLALHPNTPATVTPHIIHHSPRARRRSRRLTRWPSTSWS